MPSDLQSPAPTPQKYSRYRSVRQAAASQSPPEPEKAENPQSVAIKKSMSRYRRSSARTSAGHGAPSTPLIPPAYHASRQPAQSEKEQDSKRPKTGADGRIRQEGSINEGQGVPRQYRDISSASEQAELEMPQVDVAQPPAEALKSDQIINSILKLEEQKRKDLERLDAELSAAAAKSPTGPLSPGFASVTSPVREKFALFSRNRTVSKTTTSKSSGSDDLVKTKNNEQPMPIVQGGGGAVPGTDAPISAVNAGERRVLVRCKQSSINLPVTPETTPVDLAYSAANIMTQGVNPSAAVLLESYTQLGLERRIRRYEHVRDIMNSWDRDTQNALVLQASDSPGFDHDLDSSSVPRERPIDTVVYMYHSQKPGKWNKRYITLLSTGQVFISKGPGAKVTDKDTTSICHLSDFDIYTATQHHMRKNLRPPKKHCYAIKSQQKTTMFLNTENFVHFFSTDDQQVADKWYDAVQQWRSWYLVNQRGKGDRSHLKKTHKVAVATTALGGPEYTLKPEAKNDEMPYTIGTFSPLLDPSRFDHSSEFDEEKPRQIPFHLRHSFLANASQTKEKERHPPPVAYAHKLPDECLEGDFAPTSLLGRTYSQRQRVQREKEALERTGSGPFTGGLLDTVPGRGLVRPITSAGSGVERGKSVKRPNTASPHRVAVAKPLLELNLGAEDGAPQWKKGNRVLAPSGVPLVEVAGGIEERPHMKWGKETLEMGEFKKGSLLERRA